MKYIDAEKLKAEIGSRMEDCKLPDGTFPTTTNIVRYEELSCLRNFIDSLQQEQPMPDSTKLIELWHEDKEMLKEKDFRNDPWRLAFNAFLCGFGRGIAVKKQEQSKEVNEDFFFDEVLKVYDDNDKYPPRSEEELTMLEIIASHFYELGKNARKEDQL